MRRAVWIAFLLLGCAEDPEPVSAPPPPPRPAQPETTPFEGNLPPPTRTLGGAFFAIDLPDGTLPAAFGAPEMEDVLEAIYPLGRGGSGEISISVWRPVPQPDLDSWSADMIEIQEQGAEPLLDISTSLAGRAARLRATYRNGFTTLRWFFIADGMGGMLTCASEGSREVRALRERCRPFVSTFRLTGPMRSDPARRDELFPGLRPGR